MRNWVGNGVERLVRRALVGQKNGEPVTSSMHRRIRSFSRWLCREHLETLLPLQGVREGLDYMKSRAICWVA